MQSKTSHLSFFPGLGCRTVIMLPEKKSSIYCGSRPILAAESQKPSTFQKLAILSTQSDKSLILNLVLKIRLESLTNVHHKRKLLRKWLLEL